MDAVVALRALDDPQRIEFFIHLLNEFSPDRGIIEQAIAAYQKAPSHATVLALEAAAEAPRRELFRRFNMVPGGTQALLDLRKDLLRAIEVHPELSVVDADLAHVLRSWFNRGFLTLQRIDWHTSARILERLIQYEAVHQITSWQDLRRRLEADRRCYAFFHPSVPDEPLIFIEIALTQGMSAQVQALIDPDSAILSPTRADSAIFYSITSCQAGLKGISFGSLLIKQVLEQLGAEFQRLKTFATLSPIPQFREWLQGLNGSGGGPPLSSSLTALITAMNDGGQIDLAAVPAGVKRELCASCAWYLIRAKRDGVPLDSVARFHLANGARLERLNWLSDTSRTGIHRSFGLTVNYVYRQGYLEENRDRYARDRSVATSRTFARLLKHLKPAGVPPKANAV